MYLLLSVLHIHTRALYEKVCGVNNFGNNLQYLLPKLECILSGKTLYSFH